RSHRRTAADEGERTMAVNIHSPNERTPADGVGRVVGWACLLLDALCFAPPGLMGAHLSPAHNLIHLVTGIVSLYFGTAGSAAGARAFCLSFGAVYALLGIAGMLAGTPGTPSMPGMPADARLLRVIPGTL